jgi:hypothetical protein
LNGRVFGLATDLCAGAESLGTRKLELESRAAMLPINAKFWNAKSFGTKWSDPIASSDIIEALDFASKILCWLARVVSSALGWWGPRPGSDDDGDVRLRLGF